MLCKNVLLLFTCAKILEFNKTSLHWSSFEVFDLARRTIRTLSVSLEVPVQKLVHVIVHHQHDGATRSQPHHLGRESLVQRTETFLPGHDRHRSKGGFVLDLSGDRLRTLREGILIFC